jgi:hypothetical protein
VVRPLADERQGRDGMTVPAANLPARDFSKPANIEPAVVPPLMIPVTAMVPARAAVSRCP